MQPRTSLTAGMELTNIAERAGQERLPRELRLPWLMTALLLMSLIGIVVACQMLGAEFRHPLPEAQRESLRTTLYAGAIVLFPIANLIRFVQLKLNQTLPLPAGNADIASVAATRYFAAVLVSQALHETLGLFGLVMYMLGDSVNTLYIFAGLSALGLLLYRPKRREYLDIVVALSRDPR